MAIADQETPSNAKGSRFAAFRHRLQLLRGETPDDVHTPPLRFFLAELAYLANPVVRLLRRKPDIVPATEPKVVILLPGFATGPGRMRHMAQQLERAGHTVKRWGMGHNLGARSDTIDVLADRVRSVETRYGKPVVLIGWSMGGVFAREVAKRVPDSVSKVITMGSPFSRSPYSNNAWRAYQLVAGHKVEDPPFAADTRAKPPCETVAFWSPRDGVISRRAACGTPAERDRVVAMRCTHVGFPDSAECIEALVRELD